MNIQIATLALFIVFIAGAYSQANGNDSTTTTTTATNTSATEVHGAANKKHPAGWGKHRHGGKKEALAAVHHKKDDDKDKDKESESDDSDDDKKDHEHKGVQHGHHAKHHHGDAVVKLDLHPIVDLIKEQLHESEERILAAIAHHPGHEKKIDIAIVAATATAAETATTASTKK